MNLADSGKVQNTRVLSAPCASLKLRGHIKIIGSGPRRYVQLVQAFRDDLGRPKRRTVAPLGQLDRLNSGLDSVISGLLTAVPAATDRCYRLSNKRS